MADHQDLIGATGTDPERDRAWAGRFWPGGYPIAGVCAAHARTGEHVGGRLGPALRRDPSLKAAIILAAREGSKFFPARSGHGRSAADGSAGDSTVVKTVTEQLGTQTESTTTSNPLHLKQFQSPTHNIGCYLSSQHGGSVRCDIREHSWTAPPKPAHCDVDWGGGLQVGSKRRGSIVCAGDTVLDPGSRYALF